MAKELERFACYICKDTDHTVLVSIDKKPIRETDYSIPEDSYYREICKCNNCGVYFNKHYLLDESLYTGDYNNAIALGTIQSRFIKVISLPEGQSDNKRRVERIVSFIKNKNFNLSTTKILDIGSGTCVFLHEIKKHGLITHCIDPDENAIQHAIHNVNVAKANHGSIDDYVSDEKFQLITFNKVLEHIKNPLETLQKAKFFLESNGLIYIELPHGDPIVEQQKIEEHQEFFVEHYTIYNSVSVENLAKFAGFKVLEIKDIIDPSGKYTIYAFLQL